MKIILLPPGNGKGWRAEIHNGPEGTRGEILIRFSRFKDAHPFLQCDSPDYYMVEFWTDKEERANAAFEILKEIENNYLASVVLAS